MACHGSRGIIQHTKNHIRFIVQTIHYPGHTGCKKGGISNECKTLSIFMRPMKSLCHRNTGSHTKTGIHHVKRHGISQCITSNVTTKISFLSFHCLLHCIKRSSVRAAGTKNRRSHRKLWQVRKINSCTHIFNSCKSTDDFLCRLGRIFST